MATLRDCFETDFSGLGKIGTTIKVNGTVVEARIHLKFDANTKFVSYYLTVEASIAAFC